ncbi:MAG: hypothetical protein ABI383_15835 [Acidobacteriaceae bacterium]
MSDSGREIRQPVVEREFIAAPMFRRLGQQFSLLRRKRERFSKIDFDNLPPDTYVIYPDHLGNYNAPEILELTTPLLSADAMPPESLGAASLNFFLSQSGETAETMPQAPQEIVRAQYNAVISNVSIATSGHEEWNFLRPVLGYIAVGLVGGAMMFAIPALRRPAASLLPKGMVEASTPGMLYPSGGSPEAKPTDNFAPKLSWANTVEASEARPPFDQHSLRSRLRNQEPEVIVRHYDGHQPQVIRADSDVKRYSDWR